MSKNKYKKKNVFKKKRAEDYRFTDHFFERWNQRIKNPQFDTKEEMGEYIKKIYPPKSVCHIDGDYYLIDDIIVTCTEDKNNDAVLFVTVYGKVEDNFILYNILTTEGARGVVKTQKRYGKIELSKY